VLRITLSPIFFTLALTVLAGGCAIFGLDNIPKFGTCDGKSDLTRIPGWDIAYQAEADCNFPDPADTSLAMHIFYIEWNKRFGDRSDRVLRNLNKMFIEWEPELMSFDRGYRLDGTFIEQGKASGLTFTQDYVAVHIEKNEPIYKTSLAHELVHASIRATNRDTHGDPDHEGTKYYGWTKEHTELISEVNEILKLMDLRNAKEN
jgi:hypothetical protein